MSLTIVWPSGQKDFVAKVEPNQFITVKEGKGIISARPIVFPQRESVRYLAQQRILLLTETAPFSFWSRRFNVIFVAHSWIFSTSFSSSTSTRLPWR